MAFVELADDHDFLPNLAAEIGPPCRKAVTHLLHTTMAGCRHAAGATGRDSSCAANGFEVLAPLVPKKAARARSVKRTAGKGA